MGEERDVQVEEGYHSVFWSNRNGVGQELPNFCQDFRRGWLRALMAGDVDQQGKGLQLLGGPRVAERDNKHHSLFKVLCRCVIT